MKWYVIVKFKKYQEIMYQGKSETRAREIYDLNVRQYGKNMVEIFEE